MLALEAGAFGLAVVLFGATLWAQGRHARDVRRRLLRWAEPQGWHHEANPTLQGAHEDGAPEARLDAQRWQAQHRVHGVFGAGPFTLTAWRARRAPVGRSPRRPLRTTLVVTVQTSAPCAGLTIAPHTRFRSTPHDAGVLLRLARRWKVDADLDIQQRLWSDGRLVALAMALPAKTQIHWTGHTFVLRIDDLPLETNVWQRVLALANGFALRGSRHLAQAAPRSEGHVAQRPLAVRTRRPVAVARSKRITAPGQPL